MAVLTPEKALNGFYGDDLEEKEERRPTSWEQFTSFLFKLVAGISLFVFGIVILIFVLLFLGAVFGW